MSSNQGAIAREPIIAILRSALGADEDAVAHLSVISGPATATLSVSQRDVLNSTDDRFLLYSITKTIAAGAALQLVERGRLALDADLQAWLPDFPPARDFSLRQLLQHTAGLPDYGNLNAYHDAVRRGGEPWSEAEFLERTQAQRLRSPPGAAFAYSNIGYMLLRTVLIRAGADDFRRVLARVVFEPIGIADWSMPTTQADLAGFRFGPSRYLGSAENPLEVASHYDPRWIATGVVGTSTRSAARVMHELFAGNVIHPTLLTEMQSGVSVGTRGGPWESPSYGLGLMIDGGSGGMVGHRGGGPGCSPAVFHFPRRQQPLTVCIVTNREDSDQPVAMIRSVADLFV
jgi:CubicO group peptidase (beta-lactamase class C family)